MTHETPSTFRICIFGAPLDNGNRGVRALATSLIQLCSRLRPDATIAFHYAHTHGGIIRVMDRHIEVQHCRMSPSSPPGRHILVLLALALIYRIGIKGPARRNGWLRSLLDAHVIADIRGGDSFSDIYGVRRFLEGSLPLLTVMLLGKRFVMLPQTYGPFRSALCGRLATLLLRGASVIYTRDLNCQALVAGLCGRTPAYCPDVAFTLEPAKPANLRFTPTGLDGPGPLIGVNISGLLYMGGYTGRNMFGLKSSYRELMDQLLDRVLSETSARIVLVPHVVGEDEEEATRAILETANVRYPRRVFMPAQTLDERELKWLIGQTEFVVGARMHACIAALSQCVPAVGLAYSDKFLGVFQSAGVGEAAVDLRTTALPDVIELTLKAYCGRVEQRERLRGLMTGVQQRVVSSFQDILRLTGSAPNVEGAVVGKVPVC